MPNVLISGTGCITGSGSTARQTLDAMYAGSAAPVPFSRLTLDWGREALVYAVDDSLLQSGWGQMEQYSLTSRLGLGAALQAMEDAGLAPEDLAGKRVGVVMGTTVGCSMNSVSFYEGYRRFSGSDGAEQPDLAPISRFLRSNPAEVIGRELGVSGPMQAIVNACASGTDAIGTGLQWMEAGLCDIVFAGGCDGLSRVTLNGFNALGVMSHTPCRPFDQMRTGLNLGEGAGVLVLETEQSLAARGGKARAALTGYASACDAHHLTGPHPEGRGLKSAIRKLFTVYGCAPEDVAFINVHGTGTRDNDAVESLVMADMLAGTPFFSSKGATGHTLGAAGGIEAALCVQCLLDGTIPPTTGLEVPDPDLPAHPVMASTAIPGTTALSTSLAFGGLASVLAVSRI